MKRSVLAISTFLISASVFAQSLTGYDIMKKADEVPEPKTSSSTATLTIHSKKGSDRIREVIMKSKDYGDVKKEVIVFTTPKDVAGTGYLMFDYDDDNKDSDNWLYMPAMKKTRRIASSGSESEGSFMGTDFTYQDMGDRSLSKYDYKLLGEETVDGVACYKVECISKAHTEKDPRYITYIGKSDYIMRKCEFYDRQNQLHRVLTCTDFTTIAGFTTAQKMKMENVQTGTWSLIETKNIVYNSSDMDDSLFTVAALEKGRIR
ncbi:outer membrane lipoprotein-sorting protein [Treponema sp.]|uniref:outer membrane lipoprotein-sorting protein n=1 Tax=Treponema sp. TaxID=166 RepID=UPI00298E70AE|nr:outer membrane lipoprotein-sorting protein [Treponema sp.]MCR5612343.1 outer membrane lipoprotein-sorting protein [Treponema sp.]